MLQQIRLPCRVLSPWIAHYWHWHLPSNTLLPELFPGTGGELLFNLGVSLRLDILPLDSDIISNTYLIGTGHLFLLSPRRARLRISPQLTQSTVKFISARLRCGTSFPLLGISLAELREMPLSLNDLILKHPIPDLWHLPFIAQVNHLEQWLIKMLDKHITDVPDMALAANRLYYGDSLSTVRQELALSERTMERHIKHFIGVDARYFCRTAKFQHSLRQILAGQTMLDGALNHGYTDQSHFIKTCRFFTGLTPGELLTKQYRRLNYYQLTDCYSESK
ncbi:AraC family transcriptional regulator [Pragia fontium]|uniref:AraC family transcriptional regulator n=1 Tax=Pragia fontium TaxID=82985 RepID=UPI00064A7F5C|nr:helix-turn-helix domain-containing protein [Pragia fontium]AKJ41237.1 hypothetical protein QQ39_03355 [Pragia fontium]